MCNTNFVQKLILRDVLLVAVALTGIAVFHLKGGFCNSTAVPPRPEITIEH